MKNKTQKDASPLLLTNAGNGEPTRDEIAQAAYYLWEQQGRPQNQDVQIWLQAETGLRKAHIPHAVQA